MIPMDHAQEMRALKEEIDACLDTKFNEFCPQRPLLNAMRYSLLSGGKRIRAMLVLKFCQAAGGDAEDAMPLACAVEMLHTYSLIHDDLPCMDDDDLRRGKPTCHVAYGEAVATIAGDALQTAAFNTILGAELPPEAVLKAAKALAEAAGEMGMCAGQQLDMDESHEKTAGELTAINDLKTGAVIRAACRMGVIAACREDDEEMLKAADEYGLWLARAFQLRDDVLDVISTPEELGKNVGSDAGNGKTTFVDLMGIDGCRELVREYTETAKKALEGRFADSRFLLELADSLAVRKY